MNRITSSVIFSIALSYVGILCVFGQAIVFQLGKNEQLANAIGIMGWICVITGLLAANRVRLAPLSIIAPHT